MQSVPVLDPGSSWATLSRLKLVSNQDTELVLSERDLDHRSNYSSLNIVAAIAAS